MTRTLALLLVGAATATAQEPSPGPLRLADAVERALQHYPSVQAARAEVDGAEAATRQALAERWPYLATHASVTRFQEPMVIAPLHAFDPGRPPAFDRTLLQGAVNLHYTLFDGGRRGARIAAARARAGAAGAGGEATVQALVASVVDAYLAVLSADEQLIAQEDGVRALSAERTRVTQLLEEGRAAPVERLRVDAALAQARAAETAARNQRAVARRHLARLLGESDLDAPLSLPPVVLADVTVPTRTETLARAESASPQLEEARQQVAAAAATRRAARARWFPRIDLVGGYLGFGAGGGEFTAEWQGGVRFSYPLFSGGARSGAVAESRAAERGAAERVRLLTLRLHDQVDRTLAAVENADAGSAALAAATEHLREVVRIEHLRLETGTGTEVDYLREEADLRRVRAEFVAARHDAIALRVELARLAGSLTLEWLHRTVEHAP